MDKNEPADWFGHSKEELTEAMLKLTQDDIAAAVMMAASKLAETNDAE